MAAIDRDTTGLRFPPLLGFCVWVCGQNCTVITSRKLGTSEWKHAVVAGKNTRVPNNLTPGRGTNGKGRVGGGIEKLGTLLGYCAETYLDT
jgi:hypothetical protein